MNDAPAISPLALTAAQAGELLGIDASTVRRNATPEVGSIPKPVKIAGAVRWRLDELRDWLAAGCPKAGEWSWPTAEGAGT
jgi:predicted DNA-binding transcriptional regulator AlpA